MKRLIFLFCLGPIMTHAAGPSTSCPSGYIAIDEPNITIATSCPSGMVSAGIAESCLSSSLAAECYMYAPVGISYTDSTGTYEYTDACPLS
ncbi:MAG: hypothetical protein E7009_02840 [Alphaproteobacteria bacterium]|nr:hypothetical protein [Alphaproteobacteria bacterium]MBQ3039024.1 hypothetical protein [Alphaproteobacteria bacterium]MBQ7127434.1 hypothetical protein [Alphaproteobacteria bacterium]